jgi:hypothetical protein
LKTNFIEQVAKESAKYVLRSNRAAGLCPLQFSMRRTLIELMHADLIFIRSA